MEKPCNVTNREIMDILCKAKDESLPKYSQYVHMAMEIITKKYSSPLTIREIADGINITPKYLSSLFKKELGCSIYAVVSMMRITKAKQLMSLNYSIKVVAYELGFKDPKAFSKMFRRITGESPSMFRRKELLRNTFSLFDYTDEG